MTKEKLKILIKHLYLLLRAIQNEKPYVRVYVGKTRQKIFIDKDVLEVLHIVDEIIASEENDWIKNILLKIKNGYSDIHIIAFCPIEKTKYYELKKEFKNKVYQCCIFKQLVPYNDILKTKIG